MSDVSSTPRLGVAEDMGEERCYQGRHGSKDADGYWDRFALAGGARVGRGGYRAQGRDKKDALGVEEVREGVQLGMRQMFGTRTGKNTRWLNVLPP